LLSGSGATTASTSLNKVVQLTGFGDPVYAEAYVNVNQYDITLDVLIVNQTSDTLQVRMHACISCPWLLAEK
jgi:coatomer subunit beta